MISDCFLIAAMILITGFFAAIEAAILALNENRIRFLAEEGHRQAKTLLEYLKYRHRYLTAVQAGMTFFALLAAALVQQAFAFKLEEVILKKIPDSYYAFVNYSVDVVLILGLCFIILVFGRIIPRRYGIKNAERLVFSTLFLQKLVSIIFWPFIAGTHVLSNIFTRMIGIDPKEVDANVTEKEIRMLVDVGGNTGTIDESEKEMINNIFEFDNTMAGEIATHRTDIVAIPLDASLDDIIKVISSEKYSRIPVYRDNIDDIVGIIHVKDMVKYILSDSRHITDEGFVIQEILMKPYFVLFTKKTDELFEQMQKDKIYMAIIIDEYGGTAGIVTMEDLLEEIVGNIFDEYDREETEDITVIDENTYLLNGTTDLDEIGEILGIEFRKDEDEDYDTIGGFLIGQLGRIPEGNERLTVKCKGYSFLIEKIVEKRIETIRATKLDTKSQIKQQD